MALLIASAYAAPQLDLEENAKNINTGDYINVRDHPFYTLQDCRKVCQNLAVPWHLWHPQGQQPWPEGGGWLIRREWALVYIVFWTALKFQIHWERVFLKVAFEF